MAVRNLYRQARPFRFLGWGLFGLALLLLPNDLTTCTQLMGGLLLALCGMAALDGIRLFSRVFLRRALADAQVILVQRVELALVPAVLLLLHLPLALLVAVFGALVNANVALGGSKALGHALVIGAASLLVGWLLGGQLFLVTPEGALWLGAVLLLLVFTLALADIGFRLTQKLDDHRQQWQDRMAVLQPFVPHGLVDRAPAQERRWITVVMIDLVEFTAKSSPLAPEVVGTVLDDLLDTVVSCANQTGGTLDKFMGDGALLFFPTRDTSGVQGCESGRGDAVQSAIRFSLAVLKVLPALNSRWHGYGVPEALQLRAGIASGYCSLGQWGRSDVRAYTMIGGCVGLAERLQSVSAADSLAICPVSARLLLDGEVAGGSRELHMPKQFELKLEDACLKFDSCELALKGYAQMRVYRPSDKVHASII